MTVNEFIIKLQALQPKLREKDIVIVAPNGTVCSPEVKMVAEDPYNIFGGIENIKQMLITY